jgi:hypothetical protein
VTDFRVRLNREIDGRSDEEIKRIVDDAFGGSNRRIMRRVYCPSCEFKFDHEFTVPDGAKTVDAVTKLLAEAKGKPTETRRVEVDITARTMDELEELSDRQLAELAAAELAGAEEAEWKMLPSQTGV